MKAVVFLLRGAGWAAIGIFVGFVVSYFFRFSGRVDVFALTETMLGVVITGLAIVGAFIVALQWSNLDSRIQAFDTEVKKSNEALSKRYADLEEKLRDTAIGALSHFNNLNTVSDVLTRIKEKLVKEANDYKVTVNEIKSQNRYMSDIIRDGERILDQLQQQQKDNSTTNNSTMESEPTTQQNGLAEGEEG